MKRPGCPAQLVLHGELPGCQWAEPMGKAAPGNWRGWLVCKGGRVNHAGLGKRISGPELTRAQPVSHALSVGAIQCCSLPQPLKSYRNPQQGEKAQLAPCAGLLWPVDPASHAKVAMSRGITGCSSHPSRAGYRLSGREVVLLDPMLAGTGCVQPPASGRPKTP